MLPTYPSSASCIKQKRCCPTRFRRPAHRSVSGGSSTGKAGQEEAGSRAHLGQWDKRESLHCIAVLAFSFHGLLFRFSVSKTPNVSASTALLLASPDTTLSDWLRRRRLCRGLRPTPHPLSSPPPLRSQKIYSFEYC